MVVLGIDLGTTNSAMAYIDVTKRPLIVKNSEGKATTPSVVQFKENEVIVGDAAKNAMVAKRENVVTCVKRFMCDNLWEFTDGFGKKHRPEVISSLILRKIKKDAETALNETIKDVVITVPAYFQNMERERTKIAGEIAGFNVLRVVNEPTAAACAYGLDNPNDEGLIMVYDLGGGTFDITICDIGKTEDNVVACDGNKKLGGYDFDLLIADHFATQFKEEFNIDLRDDLKSFQKLIYDAENVKKDLSSQDEVSIVVVSGGKVKECVLTRQDFEKLIKEQIDSTIFLCKECLKAASKKQGRELDWCDINRILLVGGSSRIPLVIDSIKNLTGKDPQRGINPDEVVAVGAAIIGAQIKGNEIITIRGLPAPRKNFFDITAHSLGIKSFSPEMRKYENTILIPKGSTIPTSQTETFCTLEDYQTEINIIVLQGEEKNPDDCVVIGDNDGYTLKNLPKMKAYEVVIECTLHYNADGIIEMHALEKSTGENIETKIEDSRIMSRNQIDEAKNEGRDITIR